MTLNMKLKIRSFVTLVILISFYSCQKDFSLDDGITPPIVTPQDSITRLARVIYFYPGILGTDTAIVLDFMYDSLNRVTGTDGYDYTSGTPVLQVTERFYYTGNDRLANKKINTEVGTPYSDVFFYFYDNSQRLMRDSAIYNHIGGSSVTVTHYSYSAGIITARGNTLDTGYTGSNGEVMRTITLTSIDDSLRADFTYDDHPNPYYQLNIRSTYKPVPNAFFNIDGVYLTKNNATFVRVQNFTSPDLNVDISYSYTYNTAGYPAAINVSYDNGNTIDEQLVFVYKKM